MVSKLSQTDSGIWQEPTSCALLSTFYSEHSGDSVKKLLTDLGLGHLMPLFEANGITDVKALTQQQVAKLNLPVGPRRRIFQAIGLRPTHSRQSSREVSPALKAEVTEFLQQVSQLKASKKKSSSTRLAELSDQIHQNQLYLAGLLDKSATRLSIVKRQTAQIRGRR